MNRLHDLYKLWYEKYSGNYIKEDCDHLWLEFDHLGGGHVTYMHWDYDYSPDAIISWRTLHHGLWLMQYCVDHDIKQSWITVHYSERAQHKYSMPRAYNAVVQMLEKQLDEGKQLQRFLANPIDENVLKYYLSRDFKVSIDD